VASTDKPLAWLHGEVKSPPFSSEARLEAGYLLRSLQRGESVGMPESRAMPSIGARCHELRINDKGRAWRIVYRIDEDAIVILDVFDKKNQKTPKRVIDNCMRRIARYDST
jgi:phage-related protein